MRTFWFAFRETCKKRKRMFAGLSAWIWLRWSESFGFERPGKVFDLTLFSHVFSDWMGAIVKTVSNFDLSLNIDYLKLGFYSTTSCHHHHNHQTLNSLSRQAKRHRCHQTNHHQSGSTPQTCHRAVEIVSDRSIWTVCVRNFSRFTFSVNQQAPPAYSPPANSGGGAVAGGANIRPSGGGYGGGYGASGAAPVASGGGTTVIVQPSNPVVVSGGNGGYGGYGGYGGGSSGYSGGQLALGMASP